jgi:ABC-type amino acid transport substrate-binding protein
MGNIKSYPMMVDRRYFNPAEAMMNDIRSGEVDAGVQWGPIAAYWAARDGEKLVVVPLLKEEGAGKIAFRVTMGVRQGDDAWKRRLNEVIRKRQGDIDKVLLDYGVPLLVEDDTSMEMITKPRTADASDAKPTATTAETPNGASDAPSAH